MIIRRTEIDQFRSLMTSGNIRLLLEKDKCFNYIDNYLLATGENIIILIMVTVFISSEGASTIPNVGSDKLIFIADNLIYNKRL